LDALELVAERPKAKARRLPDQRVILEIHDEMAEAMSSGIPYKTRLDPPPADPRCCHPVKNNHLKGV
jgi:hypothetical protein